jgi:hypothetical protein
MLAVLLLARRDEPLDPALRLVGRFQGEGGTGNFQAWVAVKDTPMAPLA